jgi:hypothetical protein
MELKLNIYKTQKEIEKTYTAQDYEVMYGTVEDLLDCLDLEALTNSGDTDGIIAAASRLMRARADVINPLLLDIFPDMTEEELRRTKTREVLDVIVGLTGFSLDQIKSLTFRKR